MQWAKSSTSVVDLQLREEPVLCQKIYRVSYLKASPCVGARPVLGTGPTVPRVGVPQVLGEEGEVGERGRRGSPVFAA